MLGEAKRGQMLNLYAAGHEQIITQIPSPTSLLSLFGLVDRLNMDTAKSVSSRVGLHRKNCSVRNTRWKTVRNVRMRGLSPYLLPPSNPLKKAAPAPPMPVM
jgi:hypothetical protein